MHARFDILPDIALALVAVYLLVFAKAETALDRHGCLPCLPPASPAAMPTGESEHNLRWETPELAAEAWDLRLEWREGKVHYRLAGEDYRERDGLALALTRMAASGRKAVRIVPDPAVPHAEVAATWGLCTGKGLTPFFPLPDKASP